MLNLWSIFCTTVNVRFELNKLIHFFSSIIEKPLCFEFLKVWNCGGKVVEKIYILNFTLMILL